MASLVRITFPCPTHLIEFADAHAESRHPIMPAVGIILASKAGQSGAATPAV